MTTIFDYLNSILFKKNYIEEIESSETQYNNFMVNRWISMYSDSTAQIINDTTNTYWSSFTQKVDHYKFLINFLPKLKFKRINYIKKHKPESSDASENTCKAHVTYELSKREIEEYKSLLAEIQVDN